MLHGPGSIKWSLSALQIEPSRVFSLQGLQAEE